MQVRTREIYAAAVANLPDGMVKVGRRAARRAVRCSLFTPRLIDVVRLDRTCACALRRWSGAWGRYVCGCGRRAALVYGAVTTAGAVRVCACACVQIDRARAIYAHAAQFADPRTVVSFWATWQVCGGMFVTPPQRARALTCVPMCSHAEL